MMTKKHPRRVSRQESGQHTNTHTYIHTGCGRKAPSKQEDLLSVHSDNVDAMIGSVSAISELRMDAPSSNLFVEGNRIKNIQSAALQKAGP
eukprot:scaffold9117_cov57-Attheya_sp.AAC.6